MGIAAADYDNDGRPDLYVTGFGGNALYRSLGDCSFADVTEAAGLRGGGFSTGAAWADYDRDGHVDLFVSRYVHLDLDRLPRFGTDPTCSYRGIPVQCGPWGMVGEGDFLFRSRGDGTFEEVSARARVDDAALRYGMGAVWGDFDNDGWPDLFVANDAGENYLYRNDRNGSFTDLAPGPRRRPERARRARWATWASTSATSTATGRLDIVRHHVREPGRHALPQPGRARVRGRQPARRGHRPAQLKLVKWGTSFADLDNDGWLDLLVATGHVLPQVDRSTGGLPLPAAAGPAPEPGRRHLRGGERGRRPRPPPAGVAPRGRVRRRRRRRHAGRRCSSTWASRPRLLRGAAVQRQPLGPLQARRHAQQPRRDRGPA